MVKKWTLFAAAIAPIPLGYLYNLLLGAGIAESLVLYLFPILLVGFWFWVGSLFCQASVPLSQALLLGHIPGILSLLVYLWQFHVVESAERITALATASQWYTSSATFFTVYIAVMLEPEQGVISEVTATSMQVLGVVFMVVLFLLGYTWRSKRDAPV